MGETSFVIGIPIYDNANLLDVTGPYQVFKTPIWSPSVKLVAASSAPVRTVEGASLIPDTTFEACPPLDLLFVPGGPGQCDMMTDDAYIGFLARQGRSAKCAASVCVGALLLAAAGLLDGCKATTHWGAITALQLFPEIEVVPGYPRFVVDHKGDSLRITGGGVSAGIDEALEIVSIFAGSETAKSVQLLLQYAPKPPFDDGDPNSASAQIYDKVWRAARPLERKRIEQVQQMLSHQPTSF
jgi:cyclohexyl-isocyanide hydratase